MHMCSAIAIVLLACCAMQSDLWVVAGQSVIPGKFDVFNHKPVLLRDDKDDQEIKGLPFGLGGSNRAPLHDTPTSKCQCSEFD